jgi:hypothetical protein
MNETLCPRDSSEAVSSHQRRPQSLVVKFIAAADVEGIGAVASA